MKYIVYNRLLRERVAHQLAGPEIVQSTRGIQPNTSLSVATTMDPLSFSHYRASLYTVPLPSHDLH